MGWLRRGCGALLECSRAGWRPPLDCKGGGSSWLGARCPLCSREYPGCRPQVPQRPSWWVLWEGLQEDRECGDYRKQPQIPLLPVPMQGDVAAPPVKSLFPHSLTRFDHWKAKVTLCNFKDRYKSPHSFCSPWDTSMWEAQAGLLYTCGPASSQPQPPASRVKPS